MPAVLLMAHGSRRPEANLDLVEVAAQLRATGRFPLVEVSYLELAEPSIPDGGARCVAQGADCVLMLPYFLSAGSHVTRDLEAFRTRLAEQFPRTQFILCPPLGLHPLMLTIIEDRLKEGAADGGLGSDL